MTRASGIILAVLLTAGLSACAPAAVDEPTPTEVQPEPIEPTPTPSPTPTEQPFLIPACSELLTDQQLAELFSPEIEFIIGDDAIRLQQLFHDSSLGPVAQDALTQATQVEQCVWGFPNSDGVFPLIAAELPDDVRDHLISELRNSVFTETTTGDVTEFVYVGHEGQVSAWYGFVDNLWVAERPGGHSAHIGHQVIENVRAQNPSLG